MTKLYKKGSLPDYNGGQPPNPRDLTPKRPSHEERQCPDQATLPHALVTSCGAQVASQHCPILRTGIWIVAKLIKISSWHSMIIQKRRLKTDIKNGKIDRIIYPKSTLKLKKNCLDIGVHYILKFVFCLTNHLISVDNLEQ